MKLNNERKKKMVEFDLDLEPAEYEMLRNYGLKHIVEDDNSLINYAVVKILEESIDSTGKMNDAIKNIIKKGKAKCK